MSIKTTTVKITSKILSQEIKNRIQKKFLEFFLFELRVGENKGYGGGFHWESPSLCIVIVDKYVCLISLIIINGVKNFDSV